jgi:hypothetical protein
MGERSLATECAGPQKWFWFVGLLRQTGKSKVPIFARPKPEESKNLHKSVSLSGAQY